MRLPRVPVEEQYRLIMECRQSGLSDHQWCLSTKNPQYDENKIMELWNKKYPDFIGYNCCITAFDLMKDKISVKEEAKPFIMENTKTAL